MDKPHRIPSERAIKTTLRASPAGEPLIVIQLQSIGGIDDRFITGNNRTVHLDNPIRILDHGRKGVVGVEGRIETADLGGGDLRIGDTLALLEIAGPGLL